MKYTIELSQKLQSCWQQKNYHDILREKNSDKSTLTILLFEDHIIIEQQKYTLTTDHFRFFIPLERLNETLFEHSLKFYLGTIEGNDIYCLLLKAGDFVRVESSAHAAIDPLCHRKTLSLESHEIKISDRTFAMAPLKLLLGMEPAPIMKFVARSKQLIHWHRTSLFCSACGFKTNFSDKEIAKICEGCERIIYPHTSPAILVLIERNNQILLARSPYFRPGHYSVLAGFVEAGESLEETVVREVEEEVGIAVNNIRYFGSQPWPFENAFMIAFRADYVSGELRINPDELEDAQWFTLDKLPELPFHSSLSRKLIDAYIQEKNKEIPKTKNELLSTL